MNSLKHLRDKAVYLRKKGYSLTDIMKMLGKQKTTVYYWIKDVEIEKKNVFLKTKKMKNKNSCIAAGKATRRKFRKIHKEYKARAEEFWKQNRDNPRFTEFVMAYICEGYKKTKHEVSICNSDPVLMYFFYQWFKKLNINNKGMVFKIQIHVDQNESQLKDYWNKYFGSDLNITCLRKSNTGKMARRKWASLHGVLSMTIHDAYCKTMVDTFITLYKRALV